MADAQFFHANIYGRAPGARAKRHETATCMLNEAARVPTATGHLPHPTPPQLLFGRPPNELITTVKALGQAARDSRGRRLRSDGGLLMCLVVSHPVPRMNLPDLDPDYRAWVDAVVDWLQAQFGDALHSIVEHRDEPHGHLHAFVLPALKPDGQLEWDTVHPGRRAKQAKVAIGASKREQDDAYVAAMKLWQDNFHRAVASKFGHARQTTRRDRRTRPDHLQIRALEAENERLSLRIKKLEAMLAKTGSKPASLSIHTADAKHSAHVPSPEADPPPLAGHATSTPTRADLVEMNMSGKDRIDEYYYRSEVSAEEQLEQSQVDVMDDDPDPQNITADIDDEVNFDDVEHSDIDFDDLPDIDDDPPDMEED